MTDIKEVSDLTIERDDYFPDGKRKLIDDVKEVFDELARVNCSQAKAYTNTYLEDDVVDLLESYEEEIAPLADDNPIKIECLRIMAYIGIEVAKPVKKNEDEADSFDNDGLDGLR